MTDETMTPIADSEYSDLMPDGWQTDPAFTGIGTRSDSSDSAQDLDLTDGDATSDGTEEDLLTTTEEDEADGHSTDVEATGDQAGQPEETVAKTSRVLKLRVNHSDEEVDVDAMSDDDLTAALQKAKAYDLIQEQKTKERYRSVYHQQIDSGMTEDVAKMVAQNAVGGKTYDLEDKPATTDAEGNPQGSTDMVQQIKQLKSLYPDFDTLPDAVARDVARGTDLVTAYITYREKQTSKAAANLERENRVLKQNAANAAKAPVRGVTGGGSPKPSSTMSMFEKGFDSDPW